MVYLKFQFQRVLQDNLWNTQSFITKILDLNNSINFTFLVSVLKGRHCKNEKKFKLKLFFIIPCVIFRK
jgi:hypothetical protein